MKLEASIDKYSKEVLRIRNEETTRWTKRFKEANRCLVNLKKEITEQNLNFALDLYLQKKNVEFENSKIVMKSLHVFKINNVMQMEMDNWNKIGLKAMEIIQENYLLMRSMGELDNEMFEKLQALRKMLQGQRNVKFADDEQADAVNFNAEAVDGFSCHISDLSDYVSEDVDQSPHSVNKRSIEDNELEKDSKKSKNSSAPTDDFQFLRPKAMKSINFDSVPTMPIANGIDVDHDMNLTFDLNTAGPSSILAERTNKTTLLAPSSSTSAASKGKSNQFLLLTTTINQLLFFQL